jgi:beta-N-acetylhexosaminidase
MKPVIYGLAGLELTADERSFFADAEPLGFILFKRNVEDRAQLRALTDSLRDLTGRDDVPILVDQEGGRVARLGPPEWPSFPAGPAFDRLYEAAPMSAIQAARANGEALGLMLHEVGINVNCAPILDVAGPDTTDAITTRAYGHEPMRVAAMGRAMLEGMRAAGVVGVVKHMPGHGRAAQDTHHHLPTVTASVEELEVDLEPFRALAGAGMGMTSHILFPAWDAERPATMSPVVIEQVIRGLIGFDGLLMTDDIDMKALSGTPADKASGAIAAGCDVVLDCWARMEEMVASAEAIPDASPRALTRLETAMAMRDTPAAALDDAIAQRDALLTLA